MSEDKRHGRKISTGNIFAAIPEIIPAEITEAIVSRGAFKIERLVSRGHSSPAGFWYDQDDDEWVIVLQGQAKLCFAEGNREVKLQQGDYLFIPRHCRHRVEWTTPEEDTVWLAIHYPETEKQ